MTQKYQFVAAQASEYPVTVLCRALGLARSGYYAWRKRPLSTRAHQDKQLGEHIQRIFTTSRQTYGSPRVHAELRKDRSCGRKRLARLMRQAKLVARPRRRSVRTTDSRHAEPVAPNLLARSFTAPMPNRIWVTDITELATREGWLYLAVVLDLYARRVMESFFTQRVPALKAELPLSVFPSHAAARTAVFDYIERFYNRQRCHSSLGYRSPADYEAQESVSAKAA